MQKNMFSISEILSSVFSYKQYNWMQFFGQKKEINFNCGLGFSFFLIIIILEILIYLIVYIKVNMERFVFF